jgi:hypothetical protein
MFCAHSRSGRFPGRAFCGCMVAWELGVSSDNRQQRLSTFQLSRRRNIHSLLGLTLASAQNKEDILCFSFSGFRFVESFSYLLTHNIGTNIVENLKHTSPPLFFISLLAENVQTCSR